MDQYIFLRLNVRCSDYELLQESVHRLSAETGIIEFSENYAKEFFPGEVEDDNRRYYFDGGQIAVEVAATESISREEYYTMRRYMLGSTN